MRSAPRGLQGTVMMMAGSLYWVAVWFGDVLGTYLYDYAGGFTVCVVAITLAYLFIGGAVDHVRGVGGIPRGEIPDLPHRAREGVDVPPEAMPRIARPPPEFLRHEAPHERARRPLVPVQALRPLLAAPCFRGRHPSACPPSARRPPGRSAL